MKIIKAHLTRNFKKGRSRKVTQIMMHTVGAAGNATQVRDYFQRTSRKVSAHYIIDLNGHIIEAVSPDDTAWHAGSSHLNSSSIGIEHVDNGNWSDNRRTEAMYSASAELVAHLCVKYGLPAVLRPKSELNSSGLVLHNYYSNKACPGALDVRRIAEQATTLIINQKNEMAAKETVKALEKQLQAEKDARVALEQELSAKQGVISTLEKEVRKNATQLDKLQAELAEINTAAQNALPGIKTPEIPEQKEKLLQKGGDLTGEAVIKLAEQKINIPEFVKIPLYVIVSSMLAAAAAELGQVDVNALLSDVNPVVGVIGGAGVVGLINYAVYALRNVAERLVSQV